GPSGNLGNSVKYINNSSPVVGNTVIYTVSVVNSGSLTVTNVLVKDNFTFGVNFIPGSVSVNNVVDPTANVQTGFIIPSIAPFETKIIRFSAQITAIPTPNPYVNSVDLTYSDGTGRVVINHIIGGGATVSNGGSLNGPGDVVKYVNKAVSTIGDTLVYSFTLRNSGNRPVTSVVLLDTVPNGTTFNPGSVSVDGVLNSGNVEVGVLIGTINPGQTRTLSYSVIITSYPNPNSIPNNAIVTYDNGH
ncbi:MAG: hypothetical protein ACRC68_15280, partial [Clostridium sp.]